MPKFKIDACFTTITYTRKEVEAASYEEAVAKVRAMEEEDADFWDDAVQADDSAGDTFYEPSP